MNLERLKRKHITRKHMETMPVSAYEDNKYYIIARPEFFSPILPDMVYRYKPHRFWQALFNRFVVERIHTRDHVSQAYRRGRFVSDVGMVEHERRVNGSGQDFCVTYLASLDLGAHKRWYVNHFFVGVDFLHEPREDGFWVRVGVVFLHWFCRFVVRWF